MPDCVLCSSPNPQLAVDQWKTAPLYDWLLQLNAAKCDDKVELLSTKRTGLMLHSIYLGSRNTDLGVTSNPS